MIKPRNVSVTASQDHGRKQDKAESQPNLSRLLVWMSPFPPLSALFRQVWQCGGSIEVLPCARIAHIERAHKPYTEDLTSHVRRNALRVAEVWMDEFKSHVYMAWNIPMEVSDATLWNFTANMSVLFVVGPFTRAQKSHRVICN